MSCHVTGLIELYNTHTHPTAVLTDSRPLLGILISYILYVFFANPTNQAAAMMAKIAIIAKVAILAGGGAGQSMGCMRFLSSALSFLPFMSVRIQCSRSLYR